MPPTPSQESERPVPIKEMDVTEDERLLHRYSFKREEVSLEKELEYDLNNCASCGTCVEVCPVEAIQLGPVQEIAQGKLEGTPAILIDHDACAYCGLCVVCCPTAALELRVGGTTKWSWDDYPRPRPYGHVDEEKCRWDENDETCAACLRAQQGNDVKELHSLESRCPRGALSVKSPFEGRVRLLHNLLYKCDPNGCKACVNVCPTESFFIPQKAEDVAKFGKIAVREDTCVHCGACALVCPEHVIEVARDEVHLVEGRTGRAWTVAWKHAIGHALSEKERCVFCKTKDPLPTGGDLEGGGDATPEGSEEVGDFSLPEEEIARRMEQFERVRHLLGKPVVRLKLERGDGADLVRRLRSLDGGEAR
ncbi:MAG: hypothetical protein Kow0069_39060 [Promethearchaeota archaeon]